MLKKRIRYKLYCDECGLKAVTKTGATGGRLPSGKKVFCDKDAVAAVDYHSTKGKLLCDDCFKKHKRKIYSPSKAKKKKSHEALFCHLSQEDRWLIKSGLDSGQSFRSIAKQLQVAPSTVSREVQRHSDEPSFDTLNRAYADCANRTDCKRHVCLLSSGKKCNKYESEECPSLSHAPYVCNGCSSKTSCVLKKKFYNPGSADKEAKRVNSVSRSQKSLSEPQIEALAKRLSPVMKEGKSLYSISRDIDDLGVSLSTLYRYHKEGLI